MTNEEAIKYLIRPFATSTNSYNEYLKQKEAYDLAIKALDGRRTDTGTSRPCREVGRRVRHRLVRDSVYQEGLFGIHNRVQGLLKKERNEPN